MTQAFDNTESASRHADTDNGPESLLTDRMHLQAFGRVKPPQTQMVGARMPNFHIELRNETHVRETLSIEREDLRAARIEVAQFVGELLKDHAEAIWKDQDWRIDCTDDDGLILFTMSVFASDAAATKPFRPKM